MHPERRPNPNHSFESLPARLRKLPQPPVPAGLETRLLAAVPIARSRLRRYWVVGAGAIAVAAAACLLAVLAWPERRVDSPVPGRDTNPQVSRKPAEPDSLNAWSDPQRNLERLQAATFAWPIEEQVPFKVSTSIPADLLD